MLHYNHKLHLQVIQLSGIMEQKFGHSMVHDKQYFMGANCYGKGNTPKEGAGTYSTTYPAMNFILARSLKWMYCFSSHALT